jgi:hypothetical protein
MDKSSTTVAIPATIEDAVGALTGIDALLTAKGWERAAIVYAFTYEGRGHFASDGNPSDGRVTITDFAKLGIAGLTTRETVALYRDAWLEKGDPNIGAGDTVTLPDSKFPPREDTNFGSRVSPAKAKETVEGWTPEAKAEAVKTLLRLDEISDVVIDELANQPDIVEAAEKRMPGLPAIPKQPRIAGAESVVIDVGSLFGAAYTRIEDAVDVLEEAIRNGVQFDSELEYPVLIGQPEILNEIIARYLKTVAMVQTEEGAIK